MLARPSAIERFAALSEGTEIWWDSSPLIYPSWREASIARAPDPEMRAAHLDRLWNPRHPTACLLGGSTTNPPLIWQAMEADPETWDAYTRTETRRVGDPRALLWRVYTEACRRSAQVLEPIHRANGGRRGQVCAQVDPRMLTDLPAMLDQARGLHALAPNVMVKMPATKEGIEGIRILSAEGISTTATLCFSVAQLVAVAVAARSGFHEAREAGVDLAGVRSCAALMMGRMEDVPVFRKQAEREGMELTEALLRWAGVAVARQAHALFRERGYETKLLLASMRLGPGQGDGLHIWHLEQLGGADAVFTIFPNILEEFLTRYQERPLEPRIDDPVPDEAMDALLRIPYFRQAYEEEALTPEEFVSLPGVQATGAQFSEAMERIETHVLGI